MPVEIHQPTNTFFLQARSSTYALQIHPKLGVPIHLYWGSRLQTGDISALGFQHYQCFSPDALPNESGLSFDTLPQEFPTFGSGDFRSPIIEILQENGSRILDFKYQSYRIIPGKSKLPALPAVYVENDSEAETLELLLTDQPTGLSATLNYTVYRDFDVITRSVHLQNSGSQSLKILRALSCSIDFPTSDYEMLQLPGAWARERQMEVNPLHSGIQALESRRGASSHLQNPFLALLTPGTKEEHGEVYALNFVYSGNFLAQAEVRQGNNTRISMGINPFDFEWLLEPGEAFQTPEVVMVYSANGLGGMSRYFHSLYRTRLCRGKFRDAPRPVLINNWEATYFAFTADKLLAIAKTAAAVGMELFVLDDGWFGKRDDDRTSLGDWVVNHAKLPDGLESLAERINQLGLDFGLWFEPEMISQDSELYRAHPDWCLHVPDRRRSESRNQLVLDLSRLEVREYIIESVGKILSSVPITYVKWDMNRNMTEVGSSSLPSSRQKEISHRCILGLYEIYEKLTTRFPNVLFEGCSGGGGRFDPGILYYMPQIWASDNSDAISRLRIQYGTSLVYPLSTITAHVSAVPNHQVGRLTTLKTRGHVAMSAMLGYELDLNQLEESELKKVGEQISFYKEIRSLVQQGQFYRLRNPFTGNEAAWMVVNELQTEALVLYVQVLTESNPRQVYLQLRGLINSFIYQVDNGDLYLAGDVLMNVGLIIPPAKGDYESHLWRLRKVDSGVV